MFFFLIADKFSMIFPFLFKLLLLLDTMHAQTTCFPCFEKRCTLLAKIENLFVRVPWLASRYVSLLVFMNFSITWLNLQGKQKWPVSSFVKYMTKIISLSSLLLSTMFHQSGRCRLRSGCTSCAQVTIVVKGALKVNLLGNEPRPRCINKE